MVRLKNILFRFGAARKAAIYITYAGPHSGPLFFATQIALQQRGLMSRAKHAKAS
jgi:hypothetical protein